eukprot:COSAG06_NODE_32249_length_509_cov_0.758537_1_plen_41_part_10
MDAQTDSAAMEVSPSKPPTSFFSVVISSIYNECVYTCENHS